MSGLLIDSGTGDQISMAMFCMNMERPIMESITVSIDLLRNGFKIPFSKTKPMAITARMARSMLRRKGMPSLREKGKEKIGPEHVHFAMGEIDHLHDAQDQGQADPDQGIGPADDQAVDHVLDEDHK